MSSLRIIGTSHKLQCGHSSISTDVLEKFRAELRGVCTHFNIKCISEEMNDKGLKNYAVAKTIGRDIADEFNLSHIYIDLTAEQRIYLHCDEFNMALVKTNQKFANNSNEFDKAFFDLADGIRERYWIFRMLKQNEWPTLFICGSTHSKSIHKMGCSLGLDTKIIHSDYYPT